MTHKINSTDAYGVVCHDAGAANQILPYLKQKNLSKIFGYFQGPAVKSQTIFFPELKTKLSLDEIIQNSDILLTGSGWSSDLEHETRKLAKAKNKYCVAIIDHWVNYTERFQRLNEVIYPDEIWVFDKMAFQKAKVVFPSIPISQKKSKYEEILISDIKKYGPSEDFILYICEPQRKSNEAGEPLEIDILRTVLNRIKNDKILREYTLRLRLHPSEETNKYDRIISEFSPIKIIKDDGDLGFAIGNAKYVLGCSSYALYIAYIAGKQVISALPKSVRPVGFDMREIIHMDSL